MSKVTTYVAPAPEVDPTRIDWPARQAAAAIPFEVIDGRPINPSAPTGVERGQGEFTHWGERQAADAIVFAHIDGHRWLLMVERGDGHGWAIPGGCLDPGEDPLTAAIRELEEETGLLLPGAAWQVHPARVVPDPRATDEAWMVITPAVTDLGDIAHLPAVEGADDARWAGWVRADTYPVLEAHLQTAYAGRVFAAHEPMLSELLGVDTSERAKDKTVSVSALRDLLNISRDQEDCDACVVAHEMWPTWPHGACPYHHGINQALAGLALTAPVELPEAPFVVGIAPGAGMHAVPRDYAVRALAKGAGESGALCGQRVLVATRLGNSAFDRATLPAWATVCPYCAWAVAAATGPDAIARELDALTPTGTELQALTRLLPDPLIARHLCEAILAAQQPESDGLDHAVIELLAHASAHAPVLLSWDCDDCDDCDDEPCACQSTTACPACSLQYGSWAGDQDGRYRPECTITAPCQVLTALTAHLSLPVPA